MLQLKYLSFAVVALLGLLTASPAAHAAAPTISPELMVSSQSTKTLEPAVGVGNGVYLVAWTQEWPLGVSVLGARVSALDGAVLDAQPLTIFPDSYFIASTPAVAFDGTNFLVVFSGYTRSGYHVLATRVRASDGAVLGTVSLDASPVNKNPTVAFDGTNYLVAWWGYYYPGNAAGFYAVQGNFLRPSDGRPVLSQPFLISAAGSQTAPQVAVGGGRFLVAWNQHNDILGARVDAASKTLLDSTPLGLAVSGEDESGPTVASSGPEFLVAWQGAGGHVKATRVRGSDGAVLDGTGFAVTGPALAAAAVTFDGSDYRVAWQGAAWGVRGLYSTPVSTQGVAGTPLLLSQVHPSSTGWDVASIVAAQPGHYLVAYPQFDAQHGWDRIKARRVEGEPCSEKPPRIVMNGMAESTLECSAVGAYSDAGAQAFDGCGNPLQVYAYNSGADPYGTGPLMAYQGTYTVSYYAWDAEWRQASAMRTVHVDDRLAATLSLQGGAYLVHTCGTEWVDPGVQAQDLCYGDLTAQVVRTGQVNSWSEGLYTVTYLLTDGGGNSSASVTRTVEVTHCPW